MPLLLLTRVDCTHLLGPCDPGVGVAPGSAPQGDVLPLALSHQLVADDHGRGNEDLDLNIERSSTGLLAFSDTGKSDIPATVTVFWSKKGSPYTENHQIE